MPRIGQSNADSLETMTMGSGISPLATRPPFTSSNNDWSNYAGRNHYLDNFRNC